MFADFLNAPSGRMTRFHESCSMVMAPTYQAVQAPTMNSQAAMSCHRVLPVQNPPHTQADPIVSSEDAMWSRALNDHRPARN